MATHIITNINQHSLPVDYCGVTLLPSLWPLMNDTLGMCSCAIIHAELLVMYSVPSIVRSSNVPLYPKCTLGVTEGKSLPT